MNGYITAKQRWVADRQFKAGQPLKYRRTIGGLSKDYVLVAKYTDAIPEMWPAWFDNVYPNTWFLPSNLIDSTQIWPGDTIVDFGTGQRFYNNTDQLLYAGEINTSGVVDIAGVSLVVTPFEKTRKVKLSPFYNPDFEETKYVGFWRRSNATEYNFYLYKVTDNLTIEVEVTSTYPLIWTNSVDYYSITIYHLDYVVTYSGVSPDVTTSEYSVYRFDNEVAEYQLTFTNVMGVINIHRNA